MQSFQMQFKLFASLKETEQKYEYPCGATILFMVGIILYNL